MSYPSRGAAGQAAFASRFESDDDRRAHMRRIGARGNQARVVLTADEAAALGQAYALIDRIYRRHQAKLDASQEREVGDG